MKISIAVSLFTVLLVSGTSAATADVLGGNMSLPAQTKEASDSRQLINNPVSDKPKEDISSMQAPGETLRHQKETIGK
jgi:hypothetical protein